MAVTTGHIEAFAMANDEGINFPLTGESRRSTTATAKRVLAEALRPIAPTASLEVDRERLWRKRYPRHFRRLEEAGLRSPEAAVSIARAGLEALYDRMVLVRGSDSWGIRDAMAAARGVALHSAVIEGRDRSSVEALAIPYRGSELTGDALLAQVEDWERRGIIEPSCGAAIREVQANPKWLDLSDLTFVLLGAAA